MGGDNQQETRFQLTRQSAYLLGLTLTDGSLEKSRHGNYSRLTIVSIDRDLLEYTQYIVERMIGRPGSIVERNKSDLGKRDKFAFRISDKELVTWLAEQTQDKHYVPNAIFQTDKVRKTAFVAGVMDGDGFIGVQENANDKSRGGRGWKMQMGVAAVDPWIFDLKRLFEQERVKTGALQVSTTKYGKRISKFTINMNSYLRWGGYFRCRRKAGRLERYRLWRRSESRILRD